MSDNYRESKYYFKNCYKSCLIRQVSLMFYCVVLVEYVAQGQAFINGILFRTLCGFHCSWLVDSSSSWSRFLSCRWRGRCNGCWLCRAIYRCHNSLYLVLMGGVVGVIYKLMSFSGAFSIHIVLWLVFFR